MSTAHIEIRHDDLRCIAENVRLDEPADALAAVAAAFINSDDLLAQTAGYWLDALAGRLSDYLQGELDA